MTDDKEGDVPDYLSDDFLVECVQDVRPGLIHHRAEKRKHEQSKKHEEANKKNKFANKSRQQIEEESRQAALTKEIPADNKGFLLLQKMGYKPGTSLGKGMEGIKTPIGVEVKTNRKGLGHNSAMKEKMEKLERLKVNKKELDLSDYRQRVQLATTQREIQRDLRKAQSTCQSLDANHGKTPPEKWYWPEIPKPEVPEDEETESAKDACHQEIALDDEDEESVEEIMMDPGEQLQLLLKYLRENYFYCLWCGINYDNAEDLLSCPGLTKEDH